MPAHYNPDISPPSFKKHLIRTESLKRLDIQPKKLSLVQAPPGYGKTSFLKQIFDHLNTPCLWLNIRHSDNDPINLLHKWNSAILQLEHEDSEDTRSYTSGFTSPSIDLWARSIVDNLNKHSRLAVFLNDADFIKENTACEIITLLLQMSHSGIRFYLSASHELNFAYSFLQIENQFTRINQDALRFSTEDIQAIFKIHQSMSPQPELAQRLSDVTEGWPAAAFYMASSFDNTDALEKFISDAQLKQQAFDRFFIERVFEQQPAEIKTLLMKLSLLDRFNLEICQALSDSPAEWQAFWGYVEQHTFITPIEASGQWYRFHQLFALFLKHRCQFSFSEPQRTQWQSIAAKTFYDLQVWEEAIPLAIQAKHMDQAAQWIEDAFSSVVIQMGKHLTYTGWVKALPDEVIEAHPRLRISAIWTSVANRQFLQVAQQIQWLNQHQLNYPNPIQEEIQRTASLIWCCMEGLKDNAEKASPQIETWLNRWQDGTSYRKQEDLHYELGLALLIKGYCAKWRSDYETATEAFFESIKHLEVLGSYYGVTLVKSFIAVTYAKQGFHHEARREALEAYQLAQQKLGEKSHNGYGLAALLAAMHYEHDELDSARNYLKDALPYLKEQSPADLLIAAFTTQAKILIHEQAFEEASGFLKDAIKWSATQQLPRLQWKLIDLLIFLLIRQQQSLEAERYASEYNLILRSAADFKINKPLHNIAARSIIYNFWQRKAYTEAKCVLDQLIRRTKDKKQLHRQLEWQLLEVLNSAHLNCPETSQTQLIQTLELASSQHYIRLFLDEPAIHPFLIKLNHSSDKENCSQRAKDFLGQLTKKIAPTTQPNKTQLIEPLTSKEIEILTLLAEGLPNKQIADRLLVSIGTLKWHLHNIYNKLQVNNRTQALLEAKRLALVN